MLSRRWENAVAFVVTPVHWDLCCALVCVCVCVIRAFRLIPRGIELMSPRLVCFILLIPLRVGGSGFANGCDKVRIRRRPHRTILLGVCF